MKKTGWVIRVALTKDEAKRDQAFVGVGVDLLVTEILRYAGVVSVVEDKKTTLVFDIARSDKETRVWAEMNANRIKRFGINAVAAPKYV